MSWPSHKGVDKNRALKRMSPRERQDELNRMRRLKARNVCVKCEIRPRYRYWTVCTHCHGVYANEWKKRVKAERVMDLKREFINRVMEHRCVICREWLSEPFTKNESIRYACKNCYHTLFQRYKQDRTYKPFMYIRDAIRELKRKAGILPKTAWDTLKPRGKGEVYWREMAQFLPPPRPAAVNAGKSTKRRKRRKKASE